MTLQVNGVPWIGRNAMQVMTEAIFLEGCDGKTMPRQRWLEYRDDGSFPNSDPLAGLY